MQKRIALLFASLVASFTIAACSAQQPASAPAASEPVAVPAELEAQQVCLPRACGRLPICTANSRPVCAPPDCHWRCVPLNDPL